MKKFFPTLLTALLILSFVVPVVAAGPAQAAPSAYDPLDYFLYYMEDSNQFYFLVTNPSSQVVNLNFPSGQEYELVIRQNGKVIWKDSEGKNYTQAVRKERFLPGHAKFYKINAPKLGNGNFTVEAYFTGGPSAGKVVAEKQLQFGSPVKSNLNYYFFRNVQENELIFMVHNNTNKTINLNFPSAKEFDFKIYDADWDLIWQNSWDHWYSQAVKQEKLAPGQGKIYRAKLPKLSGGTYQIYAYFYGVNNKGAAASMKLAAGSKRAVPKLSFNAWYNGGKQPQIAFEVKNRSDKPVKVTFPTSRTVEVVVKGDNGFTWRYADDYNFKEVMTTKELTAGGASYSFIYLPQLPKGNYTAAIYYQAVSADEPVASARFKVN